MELNWNPEVVSHIERLVPYPPGKPIEETEREFGIKGVVKLASNENPLGPSPLALEAMRAALTSSQLYPDGSQHHLRHAVAAKLGCAVDEICIGCGSNEFIDLLIRVFVGSGRNLVTHEKAFVAYKLCAQLNGVACVEAAVDDRLCASADTILKAVNGDTRLVMLANPNNPTGSFLDTGEINRLATELDRRRVLLVLDYAYWEYVTNSAIPDPMEVYRNHANVMILRTFSKAYGLAGARVGYVVARRPLLSLIDRARQPFNVTSLGLAGALAALRDEVHLRRSKELNEQGKVELEAALLRHGFRVFPSQGNFLLADLGRTTDEIYVELLRRGVIVRPVLNYGLKTHLRVSVGLSAENKKFIDALAEVL